jgi:hypothetical protein
MGLKSDLITIHSATVTATGNSAAVDVSAYEAGSVLLNISAKTGAFTAYQFFLQTSPDGGTTWFGAATGTGLVVGLITGNAAGDIVTGAYWLGVNNFVGPLLRLRWTLTGGTNVTFSCHGAFRR